MMSSNGGFKRACGILLYYHNAYVHQTWQGGGLPRGALTHGVT